MRFLAYADPPYPGQARRYRGGSEVNLPLLIAHLEEFDGWALSTSASALLDVWTLCPHARCAAWTKPFASNGWSRVRWSWEPVLFHTDRRGLPAGARSTVWDSLVCPPDVRADVRWSEIPGRGGGAKPYAVVRWILDLLDYDPDHDDLTDLFPGSGSVAAYQAVEIPELPLT